jgi:DNA-binding transcriptional LysR family regulator
VDRLTGPGGRIGQSARAASLAPDRGGAEALMGAPSSKLSFMLDVQRLRALVEIARHGSLAGAASCLAYTPSAISQQIAALEREAGMPLVDRTPRGARLTAAGEVLAHQADRVLTELNAADVALRAVAAGERGRLRVGSFVTANALLLPLAVASFAARYPGVQLELTEVDRDEALHRLHRHELDVALVYEFDVVPFAPLTGVDLHLLIRDELHVALGPGSPLAARDRLDLGELGDEVWIQGVRQGSTIDVLPRACRAAGYEPRIAFRTDDQVTVQGLVAAGVGIALVPSITLPTARADLVVRPLGSPSLTRQVYAATPKGPYRLPAAQALVSHLAAVADEIPRRVRARLAQEPAPAERTA